jgi:hypothetical protein
MINTACAGCSLDDHPMALPMAWPMALPLAATWQI